MKKVVLTLVFSILLIQNQVSAQSSSCGTIQSNNPSGTSVNLDENIVHYVCNPGDCATIKANYTKTGKTTSYAVESIPYNPPAPFTLSGGISITQDDIWSSVQNLPTASGSTPGFQFCFFDSQKTQLVVGANGRIGFDLSRAGLQDQWAYSESLGAISTATHMFNTINGAYHDIDITAGSGGSFNFGVFGTYPCRMFVVNYYNIPNFSCTTVRTTQQIVLYEISNIIEVYIQNKPACPGWNGGRSIIGIQGPTNPQFSAAPGRNISTGAYSNEAWRFKPNGVANYVIRWRRDGIIIPGSNGTDQQTICNVTNPPTSPTEVTYSVGYTSCDNSSHFINHTVKLAALDHALPSTLETCDDTYTLSTTQYTYTGVVYKWYKNGVLISGANGSSYTVTSDGVYRCNVYWTNGAWTCDKNLDCTVDLDRNISVNHYSFTDCDQDKSGSNTYDLSSYHSQLISPTTGYNFTYHDSFAHADTSNTGNVSNPVTVNAGTTQTYYVRVERTTDPTCYGVAEITITVLQNPDIADIPDVIACDSYTLPALTVGNYYTGANGTGTMLSAGDVITSSQTIYVYAQTATTPNCTDEESFTVTINTTPVVTELNDVEVCDSYTLPALTVGSYYTGTNGTGTLLNAGDVITSTQTIYIFAQTATTPNCTDEDSFVVTVNQTPVVNPIANVTVCDSYTLPALTVGNYYTGANGTGTMLNAGDVISSSQTIYVYAKTGTTVSCSDEESFTVTINTSPVVTELNDVEVCDSYTLPALTVGSYYTGTNGTGTLLNAGDVITSTQTIYIFAQTATTPNCTDEDSFVVTVNQTPVVNPIANVTVCDSYTLPAPTVGNYYTGANGTGTMLNAGDVISSSQTIYVYAKTGTTISCSDEESFTVTVNQTPVINPISNVIACDSYTLPALTVGNYYTGANGTGTMLSAGDVITSSQTIYVYAQTATTPNCTDEESFTVTINTTPVVTELNDVEVCDSYTLPALTVGSYYTGTNGTGTLLNAGDVITSTQTIYIFAQTATTPNCTDEDSFVVTVNQTPVVNPIANVTVCDSYTLPALTVGNYYTSANGTGTMLNAGDVISSSQTIYVYAKTGTTISCSDEESFTVTVNQTPVINPISNVIACDSYTLPALTVGNYYTGANGTGTMLNAGDVISSSQTIYVYAQTATTPNCTDEESFTVTINTTPVVTELNDVEVCDSYTLPALTVGSYYTGTNGTGTLLNAGDVISSSQTIYVYAKTGTTISCSDEESFTVTVNQTPVINPISNVIACDSYTLPALTVGNYYTGANGTGTMLSAGDVITSSQTIYVYAQTATTPNCTDEESFTVTINTTPVVTELNDVEVCDSYTLPALTVGSYYTGTNGTGTLLNAGDVITSTQTIYIFAQTATTPNCTDEDSFVVTVNQTPVVNPIANVTVCDSYTLPALTVGNYYTGANGTGTMLNAGDVISSSQTIYVYAKTGTTVSCSDEESFTVTINTSPVVTELNDVEVCDSYTLPALTVGSYYTGTNGTGTLLNAGDVITSTQTIYIFAQTATTPNCTDEDSFVVTVNQTPVVNPIANVTVCDSYTLPAPTVGNYYTGANGTGTMLNAGDVISSSQTIYVYAKTGTTVSCSDEKSFTVTITSSPDPGTDGTLTLCKDAASVDLFTLLGGTPQSGGIWTPTLASGSGLFNPAIDAAGTYTYTILGTGPCPDQSATVVVTVNTLPPINPVPAPEYICDTNLDGNFIANLNDFNESNIITNPSNYIFSFYSDLAGTTLISNPNAYDFGTTLPQYIYVKVTNPVTGCSIISPLQYRKLGDTPLLSTTQTITECDEDQIPVNDGILTDGFDLTSVEANFNTDTSTTFEYYKTQSGAENQTAADLIANPSLFVNTTPNAQTIYVRIEQQALCAVVATIDLVVNPMPYSDLLEDPDPICEGQTDMVTLQVEPDIAVSFTWKDASGTIIGTSNSVQVNQVGTYTITMVNANGCTNTQSVTVESFPLPYIADIVHGNGTIEVIGAGGTPPYEYSFDGGMTWTYNNTFASDFSGSYVVGIRNAYSHCEGEDEIVPMIYFANTITPDGNHINEVWRIKGTEGFKQAKILIYDRYGKVIYTQQTERNMLTWDGKYQGRNLPTTSYWYKLELTDDNDKVTHMDGYVVIKDR